MIEVNIVTSASEELLADVNRLLPQLSTSAAAMNLDQLRDLLASGAVTLFIAATDGRTIGMLTLAIFPIPTGTRAWIEDVVVDVEARGLGAGELLTSTAVQHAKGLGALTVDLTSRPGREAANALYRRVGFVQRETNVFRIRLE